MEITLDNEQCVLSIVHDITERNRVQRELNDYRRNLQELVNKRTVQLRKTNEQLEREIDQRKQAKTKLQSLLDEERGLREKLEAEIDKRMEFTRLLAHELKTPLTPMLISSQTLESELKDEQLLRLARNIRAGASNLNNRIDELLDLAKGEIGMLRLKTQPLDIHPLLRELAEYVSVAASRSSQSVTVELPNSLPLVKADPVRLRQIVLNLLNNALKFAPEGRVVLRGRKENANLIIEVEDNGLGMSEVDLEKVFEPYRSTAVDREQSSGLGLGLSLCKILVELHGGEIWAKSTLHKGSTFGFSLPLDT